MRNDRSNILHPDYFGSTFQHLDDMPQNRILYRDSGKWRIETEDREVVLYSQGVNESFSEFIERAYNSENIYQPSVIIGTSTQ